ncbi:MAG: hypothetical protein ACK452_11865, partial [Bacteroidota bacterium]
INNSIYLVPGFIPPIKRFIGKPTFVLFLRALSVDEVRSVIFFYCTYFILELLVRARFINELVDPFATSSC